MGLNAFDPRVRAMERDGESFWDAFNALQVDLGKVAERYRLSRDEEERRWLLQFLATKGYDLQAIILPYAVSIELEMNSRYLMDSALGAQLLGLKKAGRQHVWHEELSVFMNMFAYLMMWDRAENTDEAAVERSRELRRLMIDSIVEENARVGAECRQILAGSNS